MYDSYPRTRHTKLRTSIRSRRGIHVAIGLVLALSSGSALANPSRDGWGFGIADDGDSNVLADSAFVDLKPKVFRFQVAYNAVDPQLPADVRQQQILRASQKIAAARAAGVQSIMVTFGHELADSAPFTRPSSSTWARGVYAFIDAFDAEVDMWGVANEPNHDWLAGADSGGPCLLAQYYHVLEQALEARGSVDLLVSPEWHDDYDASGNVRRLADGRSTVRAYIDQYVSCGGGFGDVIGWHPYGGVERQSTASTDDLLAYPSTLPVMITEVGAVLVQPGLGPVHDEAEQAARVRWLVTTLADSSPRIQRIYYYHQRQEAEDENPVTGEWVWDSGLQRRDGYRRPAWDEYCNATYCYPAPAVPPDGTFIRTPDGAVYRIVGGTPVHVLTCAAQGYYGGCTTIYNVPAAFLSQWTSRQPFPRDGTFVWHPNGAVFRAVGGALVYLSTCAAQGYFPGCTNLIALDETATTNLIDAQGLPRNGALVRAPDGSVFRMECGDAVYVNDCANVGGCAGLVDLPAAAVDQLAAAAGCDDGQACTVDRCENLVQCRHDFGAQCLAPILALLTEAFCGDGTVDAGEECDDGNTRSGDCCSATCTFEPWGSSCGGGCAMLRCDGGGVCKPVGQLPPRTPTPDQTSQ